MDIGNHSRHFEQHQRMLHGIAYRMLGSFSDAEDVVQDAYIRWQSVNLKKIDSPAAYLTSTVSRLCIDRLRKAKVERLLYTGPWLPEPVNENISEMLTSPEANLQLVESISMGFLHLLQKLPPLERAVFILREAFDLSHDQVATTLSINKANSRQLLRRAKQKLATDSPAISPSEDVAPLMNQFMIAAASGDLEGLRALMTDDIIAYSDGGGRASAALIPLFGRERVATVFMHLIKSQAQHLTVEWALLNGQLSAILRDGEAVHSTHGIVIDKGKIHRIYSMRNPDKLHYVLNE